MHLNTHGKQNSRPPREIFIYFGNFSTRNNGPMKILRHKIIIATPVETMIFGLKICIAPLFRFEHEIFEKSLPGGRLIYSMIRPRLNERDDRVCDAWIFWVILFTTTHPIRNRKISEYLFGGNKSNWKGIFKSFKNHF